MVVCYCGACNQLHSASCSPSNGPCTAPKRRFQHMTETSANYVCLDLTPRVPLTQPSGPVGGPLRHSHVRTHWALANKTPKNPCIAEARPRDHFPSPITCSLTNHNYLRHVLWPLAQAPNSSLFQKNLRCSVSHVGSFSTANFATSKSDCHSPDSCNQGIFEADSGHHHMLASKSKTSQHHCIEVYWLYTVGALLPEHIRRAEAAGQKTLA